MSFHKSPYDDEIGELSRKLDEMEYEYKAKMKPLSDRLSELIRTRANEGIWGWVNDDERAKRLKGLGK